MLIYENYVGGKFYTWIEAQVSIIFGIFVRIIERKWPCSFKQILHTLSKLICAVFGCSLGIFTGGNVGKGGK